VRNEPPQSPSHRPGFGRSTLAAPPTQRGPESAESSEEAEAGYTGLVRHLPITESYSVTVVTSDVGEAVRAAGGWMCDRVRAGWHVLALIPESCDATPLHILGVSTSAMAAAPDRAWLTTTPATLAIGTDFKSLPSQVRDSVRVIMSERTTEVIVWGDGDVDANRRLQDVHHQLSPAALCFKRHAMRAASLSEAAVPVEFLRSCAPWYPLDEVVDLNTVAVGNS
jgi:hypothetical protein